MNDENPLRVARTMFAVACIISAPLFAQDDIAPLPAFHIPEAGAPYLAWDAAWPARVGDPTKGVIRDFEGLPWRGSRVGPAFKQTGADTADLAALKALAPTDAAFEFESKNSFLIRFSSEDKLPGAHRADAATYFVYISGETVGGAVRVERTWFCVYPATAEGEPRGLAVFMPGLFGTPEGPIDAAIKQLRRHGWAVLRMLAQPSRFTARVDFDIDAAALDPAAKSIAASLPDRAAECAYAVQAAAAHAEILHPQLTGKPRIAMGFSGGAISLPTVVAREPEKYVAAILVGGGADYWLINQHSNYAPHVQAIFEHWTKSPTDGNRDALDAAYLTISPLDSFHTARALQGKPTLMIQGKFDHAVPTPLGDLLWERAGKPERWLRPVGHEFLFMNLPGEMADVMAWLDKAVEPEGKKKGIE